MREAKEAREAGLGKKPSETLKRNAMREPGPISISQPDPLFCRFEYQANYTLTKLELLYALLGGQLQICAVIDVSRQKKTKLKSDSAKVVLQGLLGSIANGIRAIQALHARQKLEKKVVSQGDVFKVAWK